MVERSGRHTGDATAIHNCPREVTGEFTGETFTGGNLLGGTGGSNI